LLVAVACLAPTLAEAKNADPGVPGPSVKSYKLDAELTGRSNGRNPNSTTRVIVVLQPGAVLPAAFKKFARDGKLDLINGQVLELPNGVLKQLAAHPDVFRVHFDRATATHNYRTSISVGGRIINQYGFKGNGIGVAVLDTGITTFHDDLTNTSSKQYPYGNQRVAKFVDFVNGRTLPYDDNGHGSHVSGTIAGNGYDSKGEKAGIAPNASLVSLKVLDQNGQGTISRMIAALGWVAANATTYNIRVVNVSVGAGVYESYWTDPLTLAAKKLTDRGITVVAAAGNLGKNLDGRKQWGGITSPANAPWVLTVGAASSMGTDTPDDDEVAGYSSSGPTYIDNAAKPDLVAPGTGTVSLAVPGSLMYSTKAAFLVDGKRALGYKPYLSLSGTSMAAPVVSATVAAMLEANPKLTPNLIKAILQYTARRMPNTSALRQGAGELDALGAVWLAYYEGTAKPGDAFPYLPTFSQTINWGNHPITGGVITPTANAWATGVVWGSAKTPTTTTTVTTQTILGTVLSSTMTLGGDNIVWGTMSGDNIVWGTMSGDNIVWGTEFNGDNIVWGTMSGDNIVWGTCSAGDNIVWGTMSMAGDNIVWGTSTDGSIVWATSDIEDVMFNDDSVEEPLPSIDLDLGTVVTPGFTVGSVSLGGL
jgi:serine protease AprX